MGHNRHEPQTVLSLQRGLVRIGDQVIINSRSFGQRRQPEYVQGLGLLLGAMNIVAGIFWMTWDLRRHGKPASLSMQNRRLKAMLSNFAPSFVIRLLLPPAFDSSNCDSLQRYVLLFIVTQKTLALMSFVQKCEFV